MLDFSVTFAFTLLNIGILYVILRAILFKPVSKFMEDRSRKIREDIEGAEKEKNQAKELRQEYEERMKNAQSEAEGIIRAAREEAMEQSGRIIAGGKAEAERIIAQARRQSEAERQAAMALFKSEAAALVIAASSRLLRREVNREDSRAEAAMLLREIGKDL